MSKSVQTTSSFEDCLYLKLSYFLYHNLILFSEKNYKKKAQMIDQKHWLKLLRYFATILRKTVGLGLEKSWTDLLGLLGFY